MLHLTTVRKPASAALSVALTTAVGVSGLMSAAPAHAVDGARVAAIDSGAGAPVTGWSVDSLYSRTGWNRSTSATIATSGIANAAPMAVYQTERIGRSFSYASSSLAAGHGYTLRLHFVEPNYSAAGKRLFNVTANGQRVLTNFDIYAAAGARNKAVVRDIPVKTGADGGLNLGFAAVRDYAGVAGVELFDAATGQPAPTPAPTSSAPGGMGATLFNDPWANPTTDPNVAKAHSVVLHQSQASYIPALRAAHPGVKIYVYLNASAYSTAAGTGSFQPNVVTSTDVQAHPEWVLKNSRGTNFTWGDFTYLQPLDLGSSSYQQTAVTRTVAELRTHGWDGVMLDDVNYDDLGHDTGANGSATPSNLTGGTRLAATTAFLKAFTPAIHAQTGKEVVINAEQRWDSWQPAVDAWAPYADVFMLEHASVSGGEDRIKQPTLWNSSTGWTGDYNNHGDVDFRLKEAARIQALGARFWTHDYIAPEDTQAMRFHRAQFLLSWDGKSQSQSMTGPVSTTKSYYSPAGAFAIGTPTTAVTQPQPYLYKRSFTQGDLYLNAGTAPVQVNTLRHGTVTIPVDGVLVD